MIVTIVIIRHQPVTGINLGSHMDPDMVLFRFIKHGVPSSLSCQPCRRHLDENGLDLFRLRVVLSTKELFFHVFKVIWLVLLVGHYIYVH